MTFISSFTNMLWLVMMMAILFFGVFFFCIDLLNVDSVNFHSFISWVHLNFIEKRFCPRSFYSLEIVLFLINISTILFSQIFEDKYHFLKFIFFIVKSHKVKISLFNLVWHSFIILLISLIQFGSCSGILKFLCDMDIW